MTTHKVALVTGGAGFIGSNLTRLLTNHGVRVRVLDNLSTGYAENLEGIDCEFLQGDVRDRDVMSAACRDATAVFHLAAQVGNVRSLEDPFGDADINVKGTINVLEVARTQGVSCVVYSSSAATFGEVVSPTVAEDHPQNPESPYGVSKLAGEKLVMCYGRLYGMRTVALRYFNVYGKNQVYDAYGNVIPIFARRILAGESLDIFGDGEQSRDFVSVEDVAMANWLACSQETAEGVFNIGCGTPLTVNELARMMVAVSGRDNIEIRHLPPRKGEVRHCTADATKARASLGFKPSIAVREGLREYWEWVANRGPA